MKQFRIIIVFGGKLQQIVSRKFKVVSTIYFFLVTFFLSFQNCSYQGNLVVFDNNSNSGNGGIYEGKLKFVLHYKEQTIFDNSISLYSGESFQYEISGGTPPYNSTLVGDGFLNSTTQTFTAPYLLVPTKLSKIAIQDSVGESAEINISVLSFTTSSKLMYPLPNTKTNVDISTIQKNNLGLLFNLVSYTDHQFKTYSILRQSADQGKTWNDIHEFDSKGNLYISSNNNLFFISNNNYFPKINDFWSSDNGATWNPMTPPSLALSRSFTVLPTGDLLITGVDYDSTKMKQTWVAIKISDMGKTWIEVDRFNYNDTYNSNPNGVYLDDSGSIWVFGSAAASGTIGVSILRKGTNNGTTWTTDFTYTDANFGFSLNSIVKTTSNFLLLAGTGNDSNNKQFTYIYKKDLNINSSWSLIRKNWGIGNSSSPRLFIDELNNIYCISNEYSNSNSRYVIEKSTDQGLVWTKIFDELYSDNTKIRPQNIFSYNGKLLATAGHLFRESTSISYIQSLDGGATWFELSQFAPLSKVGGIFYVRDMIELKDESFLSVGWSSQALPSLGSDSNWNVQITKDNGTSWTDSDVSPFTWVQPTRAESAFKSSKGDLFVVGQSESVTFKGVYSHKQQWAVRKSSDEGKTWENVDIYAPEDSFDFGNTAFSITEDEQGAIYVYGYIYYFPKGKKIVRKSTDEGLTWTIIDNLENINDSRHKPKIKYCGKNNLFLIDTGLLQDKSNITSGSTEYYYKNTALRMSKNNGLTWSELPINNIHLNSLEPVDQVTFTEISCDNSGEVILFGIKNGSSYINYKNAKLFVLKSKDFGLNWSQVELPYEDTIVNSVVKTAENYWLGGVRSGDQWSIVKTSLDFSEMAEVDRNNSQESSSSSAASSSSVIKLLPCKENLCAIGIENRFSRFKVLQLKY